MRGPAAPRIRPAPHGRDDDGAGAYTFLTFSDSVTREGAEGRRDDYSFIARHIDISLQSLICCRGCCRTQRRRRPDVQASRASSRETQTRPRTTATGAIGFGRSCRQSGLPTAVLLLPQAAQLPAWLPSVLRSSASTRRHRRCQLPPPGCRLCPWELQLGAVASHGTQVCRPRIPKFSVAIAPHVWRTEEGASRRDISP